MKLFLGLLLVFLVSCCSHESCITPPPMATSEQNTVAGSIALSLAGAPASGSLSGSYSSIVKNDYDKLADNDKALFLFLKAIDCYLKDGKVGQDIAKQMAQAVQTKWASKEAPSIPTARLNFKDHAHKIDARSPDVAPGIHAILKKVGVE